MCNAREQFMFIYFGWCFILSSSSSSSFFLPSVRSIVFSKLPFFLFVSIYFRQNLRSFAELSRKIASCCNFVADDAQCCCCWDDGIFRLKSHTHELTRTNATPPSDPRSPKKKLENEQQLTSYSHRARVLFEKYFWYLCCDFVCYRVQSNMYIYRMLNDIGDTVFVFLLSLWIYIQTHSHTIHDCTLDLLQFVCKYISFVPEAHRIPSNQRTSLSIWLVPNKRQPVFRFKMMKRRKKKREKICMQIGDLHFVWAPPALSQILMPFFSFFVPFFTSCCVYECLFFHSFAS